MAATQTPPARGLMTAVGVYEPTTTRFGLRFRETDHGMAFGSVRPPELADDTMDLLAGYWLHVTEQRHYAGLRLSARRSSFLHGRMLAKTLMREIGLEDEPRDIEIDVGLFGQPVVRHPAPLRVTLSHTSGMVCAVVSDDAVPFGVDVETIDAARSPVLRQAMARDVERFHPSRGHLSPEAFAFALWTQKESVGKATNIGLTSPMSVYDVSRFEWPVPQRAVVEFANLSQFACETWCSDRLALSLAYPRLGTLDHHLEDLVAGWEEMS